MLKWFIFLTLFLTLCFKGNCCDTLEYLFDNVYTNKPMLGMIDYYEIDELKETGQLELVNPFRLDYYLNKLFKLMNFSFRVNPILLFPTWRRELEKEKNLEYFYFSYTNRF